MANQYTERESGRYGRRAEGSREWGQGYAERGYEGRDYEERGRAERMSGESRSFSGDEGMERRRGYEEGHYGDGRYGGGEEYGRGEGYYGRAAYPRESERGTRWGESEHPRAYQSDFEHGGRGYGREGGYSRAGGGWQTRAYNPGGWSGERALREDWTGFGGAPGYEDYGGARGYEGYGGRGYGEEGWTGMGGEMGYRERGAWPSQGPYAGRGPQGYKRSDERITEDINERLTQHGQIDASEIQVNVRNGEVTLSGAVNSRQAKRLAEDIAESCSGVKEVQNQLRVQSSEAQSEQQRRTTGQLSRAGQQSRASATGQPSRANATGQPSRTSTAGQTEQKRSTTKQASR